MTEVIGVRFKRVGKVYYFNPDKLNIPTGAHVIVETARGVETVSYTHLDVYKRQGGMHIDGVEKCAESFEHIDPELVGNTRKLLTSEMAGRSTTVSYTHLDVYKRQVFEFITRFMTLRSGDVIATGTPEGVGPMSSGDVVEVRIEGIGSLRNTVVDEA